MLLEMELLSLVQILDKVVYISLCTNALQKGMNLSLLFQLWIYSVGLVWLVWVLWHINHCRLCNAKSSLYICIDYIQYLSFLNRQWGGGYKYCYVIPIIQFRDTVKEFPVLLFSTNNSGHGNSIYNNSSIWI